MNIDKIKEQVLRRNLKLSLFGVGLIVIPFLLLGILKFFDDRQDMETVFFIGIILLLLSLPMAVIVISLYIAILSVTVPVFTAGDRSAKNITALSISIIAIIICIIEVCRYLILTDGLIDAILRMG